MKYLNKAIIATLISTSLVACGGESAPEVNNEQAIESAPVIMTAPTEEYFEEFYPISDGNWNKVGPRQTDNGIQTGYMQLQNLLDNSYDSRGSDAVMSISCELGQESPTITFTQVHSADDDLMFYNIEPSHYHDGLSSYGYVTDLGNGLKGLQLNNYEAISMIQTISNGGKLTLSFTKNGKNIEYTFFAGSHNSFHNTFNNACGWHNDTNQYVQFDY